MFERLFIVPQDPLLKLINEFKQDTRQQKIDLGVGVYRNENGATPVMKAVRIAEERLLTSQQSKCYLGIAGDLEFLDMLGYLVFGGIRPKKSRFAYLQTPGGSAALRLGADIIKLSTPESTVWIGDPSWTNHIPIFTAAGLHVKTFPAISADKTGLDLDQMMSTLASTNAGDVLLLQGCGHNPSGMDLEAQEWKQVADLCVEKGIIPFLDLAYHGLVEGLEEDLKSISQVMEVVPEALVAVSCSKNFGLYRERTGALYAMAPNIKKAEISLTNLFALARVSYSMPPNHGAAIVKTILKNEGLKQEWEQELFDMRNRIKNIRKELHLQLTQVFPSSLDKGKGMFSLLPLTPQQIDKLKLDHGIYMPYSGRINIAGLNRNAIPAFVKSVSTVAQ